MTTNHPFQKLCCVLTGAAHHAGLLFAASGPDIFTFSSAPGSCLARWSATSGSIQLAVDDAPHPNKRLKLDPNHNGIVSREDSEESIEIKVERQKGERRKSKVEQPKISNVSHLLVTSNGRTLLAVTASDKTVRVFDVNHDTGVLTQRSARSMPKRVCAILLDPSEKNIVVGDKFGDVYSLPLHPSQNYTRPISTHAKLEPSATELTVHTKGNLEALRQQREQKKVNPRKEGPEFEHKLLLGHVSLLTDVLIASDQAGGRNRSFILTADRDEHIRVSRYPQAHIIEGYCLGSHEFVSKLCTIESAPQYLIAGGGDATLRIYDWRKGVAVYHMVLSEDEAVRKALSLNSEERSIEKLSVSGIWSVGSSKPPGLILVALEGLPILLTFELNMNGTMSRIETIELSGNVLDVSVSASGGEIFVSLDTIHVMGSTKTSRAPSSDEFQYITAFKQQGRDREPIWVSSTLGHQLCSAINDLELSKIPSNELIDRQQSKGEYSTLGEFLYGLENLRKRRDQGQDDGEEEDGDVDAS